jgi:hypothetical protein
MILLPLFVRKFILDFVETALAAVFVLNIAFPTSFNQTQQVFVTIGLAVFSALVSTIRRTTPEFLIWLTDKLGLSDTSTLVATINKLRSVNVNSG